MFTLNGIQPRRGSRISRRCRIWMCFVCAVFSTGCLDALPGKPTAEDRYQRPDQEMDFPVLYKKHCSGCHGADGELGPAPPLNDSMFLAIISDADFKEVLDHGRKGTPMPAMAQVGGGPLTEKQIESLIAGIRAKWGTAADESADQLPKYLATGHADGDSHAGSPEAGKEKFSQFCADCHGADGRGGGEDGPGALNDPAFLGTISNQALRRFIITGRSDLGMPNFREAGEYSTQGSPLTSEDIADLVALLASWRAADITTVD